MGNQDKQNKQDRQNKQDASALPTLRERAVTIIHKKAESQHLVDPSKETMQEMLYELHVHQVELEMQNEELRRTQLALEESRARYFDLYDLAPAGYFTLSESGLILQTNLVASTLLCGSRAMLVGQPISRFIDKEYQDSFYLLRKKLLHISTSESGDFRMTKTDGMLFWGHLELTIEEGEVGDRVLRLILLDVTERVHEKAQLLASLEKIHDLELAINEHAIVAITDVNGDITYVNDKFCCISHYSREELLGQNHRITSSGQHPRSFMRDLWRTISEGRIWKGEIINRAKDGSYYWVDMSILPSLDAVGQVHAFYAICRDITEQKNSEQALRHAAAQLRELSAHQSRVKENERKRIAREIHDELGGMLTGIKSYLSVLVGRAQRETATVDPVLIDASTMADQAIDTVRKLITELRPSVLDQLGIWAALESHAIQITRRTYLTCDCQIDASLDGVDLDPEASTAAFRIVQELMTNVIRHAQASRVDIRATRAQGWVAIEVTDDGIGISSSHIAGVKSWGIIGMHERALQCNGELTIQNAPTGGTLAVLRLPLGSANDQ